MNHGDIVTVALVAWMLGIAAVALWILHLLVKRHDND